MFLYNTAFIISVFLLCRRSESYVVQHATDVCITPLEEESQCVPLKECPVMVNFINNAERPFPAAVTNAIQKFVCRYSDKSDTTVICCPSIPFEVDKDGNIKGPAPPPPSIANHESLKYLPEECGLIGSDDKISGGEDADLTEFPWMALLLYKIGEQLVPKCGGTIIHKKYILTAAHCLVKIDVPLVGVRVGEHSLSTEKDCAKDEPNKCLPPVQHLIVEKIITHPSYSSDSFVNDIALLRVTNISFEAENAKPVCLPVHEDTINKNFSTGLVTGWGYTDANGTNPVDRLQKVSLKRRELDVCVKAFKEATHIKLSTNSYKRLCLGGDDDNKDSCKGDSGGPFQVAYNINGDDLYVQRGIVSLGHIECGKKGSPAIYTNVDYYMKWILDNIRP